MRAAFFIYVGQSTFSYALARKRDYTLKREVHVGFAYLAAVLEKQGVEPRILDLTITGDAPAAIVELARRESPVFVGFYAAAAMKSRVTEYIAALSAALPELKILVGGPDCYEADDYLAAGAHAFCVGEGEVTILELLDYCTGGRDLASINGIAYRRDGQMVRTPPRELIKDLSTLPVPAWHRFDLTLYHDYHVFDMRTPYASIMASRGCPFRCTYCISHEIWQHTLRVRPPEHVMEEIDYLVRERGVRYLTFQDDIWSWESDDWGRAICTALLAREYDLKWRCILHPLSFRKSRGEMLSLMHKAGCTSITTGLQSASPRILRNIRRSPAEPEALAELVGVMKRVGILNNTAFIFGLPGDDDASMEESIQFALRVRPTFVAFYTLSVLPGSDIWRMAQKSEYTAPPEGVIEAKCRAAARRFYSDPRVVLQLVYSVLRVNPMWLLRAARRLPYFLQMAGRAPSS